MPTSATRRGEVRRRAGTFPVYKLLEATGFNPWYFNPWYFNPWYFNPWYFNPWYFNPWYFNHSSLCLSLMPTPLVSTCTRR